MTEAKLAQLKKDAIPAGTVRGEDWAAINYNKWATAGNKPLLEALVLQSEEEACVLLQHWFVELQGSRKADLDDGGE